MSVKRNLPTLLQQGLLSFPGKDLTPLEKSVLDLIPAEGVCRILEQKQGKVHLVEAFTGSGKSTVLPVYLYKSAKAQTSRPGGYSVLVAEPRVNLCINAGQDIANNNPDLEVGREISIQTGTQKIQATEHDYMAFATTQIVQNFLNKCLNIQAKGDQERAVSQLNKYAYVCVDEAHVLEIQTLTLIKTIKNVTEKFDTTPKFLFMSATMDEDQILKYFNLDKERRNDNVIIVKGLPNFEIKTYDIEPKDLKTLIHNENQANSNGNGQVHNSNHKLNSSYEDHDELNDDLGQSELYNEPILHEAQVQAETVHGNGYNGNQSGYGNWSYDREKPNFNKKPIKPREDIYSATARFFMKRFYDDLYSSTSYVNIKGKDYQCRDALIFVPSMKGINSISSTLMNLIEDKPKFKISQFTLQKELDDWRRSNKGHQRILVVGYGASYSNLSLNILATPYENEEDVLEFETKIIVSTSVIETGKTFSTLKICVDLGLHKTTIYSPLTWTFKVDKRLGYLKTIPANRSQIIQRRGRVGRMSPGTFMMMYSNENLKFLEAADYPQTINNSCLSNLLYDVYLSKLPQGVYDIAKFNDFLFPLPIDMQLVSFNDLFLSGILGPAGEYVPQDRGEDSMWIEYAKFAYYQLKWSLFKSIMIAAINKFKLPRTFQLITISSNQTNENTFIDSHDETGDRSNDNEKPSDDKNNDENGSEKKSSQNTNDQASNTNDKHSNENHNQNQSNPSMNKPKVGNNPEDIFTYKFEDLSMAAHDAFVPGFIIMGRQLFKDIVNGKSREIIPYRGDYY